MKRRLIALALLVAALAAAATHTSSSRAADPGPPPVSAEGAPSSSEPALPSSGNFAPYPGAPDVGGVTPDAGANSNVIQAGSCYYRQRTDDVHISSTAPKAVSVHAWWVKDHGTCPATANVDAFVEAYWCDQFGCQWIDVATNSKDVHQGGGSSNWVAARKDCSSTSKSVGWRGAVDVDLNGVSDPGGRNNSTPINFLCVP